MDTIRRWAFGWITVLQRRQSASLQDTPSWTWLPTGPRAQPHGPRPGRRQQKPTTRPQRSGATQSATRRGSTSRSRSATFSRSRPTHNSRTVGSTARDTAAMWTSSRTSIGPNPPQDSHRVVVPRQRHGIYGENLMSSDKPVKLGAVAWSPAATVAPLQFTPSRAHVSRGIWHFRSRVLTAPTRSTPP